MKQGLKLTRYISEAVAAAVILFFLVFSEQASRSALYGMRLCAEKLIPSLFPILTASGIFVRCGGADRIARTADGLFRRVFRISGENAMPFFMGILCSAPAGGSTLKSIRDGRNSRDDGSLALLLSSTVSVGFLVSFVGVQLLGSKKRGLAIFLIQLISTIISALILRSKKTDPGFFPKRKNDQYAPLSDIISSSLRDALQSMLSICGGVIFFSSLSGIALSLPISAGSKGFISAFFEITSGVSYLCSCFSPDTAFILICSAAGWSGLSMICQTASASGGGIPIGRYVAGKALSALLSPIIAFAALHMGII